MKQWEHSYQLLKGILYIYPYICKYILITVDGEILNQGMDVASSNHG